MSKPTFGDLGLGLLWLPAGFLFILLLVAGLFLMAHDAPSLKLSSAHYQTIEG